MASDPTKQLNNVLFAVHRKQLKLATKLAFYFFFFFNNVIFLQNFMDFVQILISEGHSVVVKKTQAKGEKLSFERKRVPEHQHTKHFSDTLSAARG